MERTRRRSFGEEANGSARGKCEGGMMEKLMTAAHRNPMGRLSRSLFSPVMLLGCAGQAGAERSTVKAALIVCISSLWMPCTAPPTPSLPNSWTTTDTKIKDTTNKIRSVMIVFGRRRRKLQLILRGQGGGGIPIFWPANTCRLYGEVADSLCDC